MEGIQIFFIILAALGVFLLCRELVCWYFKINRMAKALDNMVVVLNSIKTTGSEIANELRQINENIRVTGTEQKCRECSQGDLSAITPENDALGHV